VIILGLLLVALICLVVGLVLPSTAWLIASLIASVGAGYVLFRARTFIAGAHAVEGGGAATSVLEREPDAEPAAPRRSRSQARAEARAEKAAQRAASRPAVETDADEETAAQAGPDAELDVAPHASAGIATGVEPPADAADAADAAAVGADEARETELSSSAVAAVPEPSDVREAETATEVSGGELLAGFATRSAPDEDADESPRAEAHDEARSEPESAPASAAAPEPIVADEGDVWVIDGRPRYHLATCAIIQGQDAEPIPFEQATEDGFMPCSLCEPNVVRATAS
jgi:hypothetical protein